MLFAVAVAVAAREEEVGGSAVDDALTRVSICASLSSADETLVSER